MKECTKCKVKKKETEFYKEKRGKDGLMARCKQCMLAACKTPERKESMAAYNKTPEAREARIARDKTEEYKKVAAAHKQTPEYKEARAIQAKTPEGKLIHSKCMSKRERELGFKPLNREFKGSHGHHLLYNEKYAIDPNTVIYIPTELHKPGHGRTHPGNQREVNIKAAKFLMDHGETEQLRHKGSVLYTAYCMMPIPTWFKEEYCGVLNVKKERIIS